MRLAPLVFLFLIIVFSCDDDESSNERIELVANGKKLSKLYPDHGPNADYYQGSGTLYIDARFIEKDAYDYSRISLFVENAKVGSFDLRYDQYTKVVFTFNAAPYSTSETQGTQINRQLTITKLDTKAKLVSGTFSGECRSLADASNSFTITSGRFDNIKLVVK
jgi:hypothetical protein